MNHTNIKHYFAKEWLIIISLCLLTLPIGGVIYGIRQHNQNTTIKKLDNLVKKSEYFLKEIEAELINRKQSNQSPSDKLDQLTDKELLALINEDYSNLSSKIFLLLSTNYILEIKENIENQISQMEERKPYSINYLDMVGVCFLFLPLVWILSIIIRITIWSVKIIKNTQIASSLMF